MLTLSSAYLAEKNKLSSSGAWIILIDLTLSDGTTHVRLAKNTDDIVWDGQTYQKFPLVIDDLKEEKGGEHTILNIRVGNVTRALMVYMEGEKGLVGCDCTLYVVHSDNLGEANPAIEETFTVTSSHADNQWINVSLSAANLFQVQFPDNRYLRSWCRFKFNYPVGTDVRCGYTGDAYQECNKTLANCRLRFADSDTLPFGGFPGIPEGGLYAANE